MDANKTIFGKIFYKEFFMKKSIKLIAGLCASVMLLTGGLMTAVSAAAPAEQSMSYADYATELYILHNLNNCELLPNGFYRLPNGMTITHKQYFDVWAKYYCYTDVKPILPPTYVPPMSPSYPSRPNVLTEQITMDLYESVYVGYYGAGYNYTSTNPAVAYVDMYGRITATAPGTAYVMVENSSYTFKIITVTVNQPTVESEADLGIRLTVGDRYLKVGETTSFSAAVTVKGYTVYNDNYTVEFALTNSEVLSIDTNAMTITALKEGSSDIVATITGTGVNKSVIVYVDTNYNYLPTPPEYWYPTIDPDCWYPTYAPNYWYPYLPEHWLPILSWPSFSDGKWVVTEPGQGIVGGLISGIINGNIGDDYKDKYNINVEYDPSEYTVTYKVVFYNGSYYRVPVYVKKDAADTETETDSKTEILPEKPTVLTPEEVEKLIEEQRQAAHKQAIELALAGKVEWYEVYPDVIGDNIYASGVDFALNSQLLTGKDDGSFGTEDEMTYGDVAALLCTYMDITEEELAKTGILPKEDADTVISREEVALVFYNVAKKMDLDLSAKKNLSGLKDYDELDAKYRAAYEWATASKLMINTSSKANPNAAVTKEMLAFIIYRFNNLVK